MPSCLVMIASFDLNCYSTDSKVVDSLHGHIYDVPGSYLPYSERVDVVCEFYELDLA